ncbi:hypothetical protein [Phascolarctobacterium succinatutens]
MKKIYTLMLSIILTLCVTASCFAKDLENIKFRSDLDDMNSLPNMTNIVTGTQHFAYHSLMQFNPENILNHEVQGIEYDFFKKRLFEINITFKNTDLLTFNDLVEQLGKKYGKPQVMDLSGPTFAALGYTYNYKNNNYDLNYYHNKIKKTGVIYLTVKTNFMAPDENCLGYNNYKPKEPKTLDDLVIFK